MSLMPFAVREAIELAPYTTIGIGGPARYLSNIACSDHLKAALSWARARALPTLILGRGSNCLIDDSGFSGLVLINEMRAIEWSDNGVNVESGYSLAQLGVQSAKKGLGGLEFASGIPGSVGGGIYMNAGAYGSSIAERVTLVEWIDEEGKTHICRSPNLAFGYRTSFFQSAPGVIWRAQFHLQGDVDAIQRCQRWTRHRMHSQPAKSRSVGCIFRNPPHISAGALIDQLGLKGRRVGDAQLSPIHANYIVNLGAAKCEDVRALISLVRAEAQRVHRLHLDLEVREIPSMRKEHSLSTSSVPLA